MIAKIAHWEVVPQVDNLSEELQNLIDVPGLSKHYIKITAANIDRKYICAIRDIAKLQYKLPIKFLKPIQEDYSYVAQKSQIYGDEHDIKNAAVTIEPLNPNFLVQISYTPINQSIPLGTIVNIHEEIPFNETDDKPLERMFLWSSNLKTDADIVDVIKRENPDSINTLPWNMTVHYGSIDIGSVIDAKFEVSEVDPCVYDSFAIFRFNRCDEKKEFVIYTYDCFNITPKDVLKMLLKQTENGKYPELKEFCKEALEKYPK